MVSMKTLTNSKRTQVVAALVEGCSIRSTVRMTGVAQKTGIVYKTNEANARQFA